jgi:hypothetical protein
MIPPGRSEETPTPEMLAGVAVEIEAEEDITVRRCQPPQTDQVSGNNGVTLPTVNQLAGVYLDVEAPEDLTVRPASAVPSRNAP